MIVLAQHTIFCGTVGCNSFVLQKQGGRWVEVGGMYAGYWGELCVISPGPAGPPILASSADAMWWNGEEFDYMSLDSLEDWQVAELSSAERARRDELIELVHRCWKYGNRP